MNAQLSTNLRRIGLPVVSVGLGLLLIGAAIVAATLSRPSAPARQAVVHPVSISQGVPIRDTGSAYDGGEYNSKRLATHTLNGPISGTGSVYDGGQYIGTLPMRHVSPSLPIIGTGSAY